MSRVHVATIQLFTLRRQRMLSHGQSRLALPSTTSMKTDHFFFLTDLRTSNFNLVWQPVRAKQRCSLPAPHRNRSRNAVRTGTWAAGKQMRIHAGQLTNLPDCESQHGVTRNLCAGRRRMGSPQAAPTGTIRNRAALTAARED